MCICIVFSFAGCNVSTPKYYINETMPYEEIDITVNSLQCIKNNNPDSERYGLFELTISFTLKNNKTKDFNFSFDNIYIKSADKGEKYDYTPTGENLGDIIGDYFLGEVIIAGATETYNINFYVPYSLEEKKYIMCFDWGFFSEEQEYYLYLRDGTNASYEDNSNTELTQTLINLRNNIYTIFKEYVYDQITSGMYYSDIQKLVDSAVRQCKSSVSQLNVYLDFSNGTYYPKWIIFVNADKNYPLIYIEVELPTAYKYARKYIGKYELS